MPVFCNWHRVSFWLLMCKDHHLPAVISSTQVAGMHQQGVFKSSLSRNVLICQKWCHRCWWVYCVSSWHQNKSYHVVVLESRQCQGNGCDHNSNHTCGWQSPNATLGASIISLAICSLMKDCHIAFVDLGDSVNLPSRQSWTNRFHVNNWIQAEN